MSKFMNLYIVSLILLIGVNAFAAPLQCDILFSRARSASQPIRNAANRLTEDQVINLVKGSDRYQDKRNKDWLDSRKCLCCHTTLTYALSRNFDQESKSNFETMIAMAKVGVTDVNQRPWYNSDQSGFNSKPTEAVLNSITLLFSHIRENQNLDAVTTQSVDQIFNHLGQNGRLKWLNFGLQPFESIQAETWGNSMAVLAIETAKSKNYQLSEAHLNKYKLLKNSLLHNVENLTLNEIAVLLWANSVNTKNNQITDKVLKPEILTYFVNRITEKQNANGSWKQNEVLGMGRDSENAYATAIAMIGLIKSGQYDRQKIDQSAIWLSQKNEKPALEPTKITWPDKSINRENARLNNTFATDVATSYSSMALEMYKNEVLNQ